MRPTLRTTAKVFDWQSSVSGSKVMAKKWLFAKQWFSQKVMPFMWKSENGNGMQMTRINFYCHVPNFCLLRVSASQKKSSISVKFLGTYSKMYLIVKGKGSICFVS